MKAASPADILPMALDVVLASGAIVRDHHSRPRKIRRKGRIDLVTETDLAVESYLKDHLSNVLPGVSFIAEESAKTLEPSGTCWIIDPLDGTTNFAHGLPLVATSVALWHEGQVALGIVNAPLLGECYHAVRGKGAFARIAGKDEKMSVTVTGALEEALVATGFPYDIEKELSGIIRRMQSVLPKSRGVRRCGAAALDLAWLAVGRFDCFYETCLKPWDMAAGWLLVEEAGGRLSHFDGSPQSVTSGEVLATNGRLHDEMIRLFEQI